MGFRSLDEQNQGPRGVMMHEHSLPGFVAGMPTALVVAATVCLAAAYVTGAARLRRRGDMWPYAREWYFVAGSAGLGLAALAPLPGGVFTAHMIQHVIVGMIAPLLLVVGRPVTLILRVLPPNDGRRRLLTVARSRLATVLVFPPLAALLDVGGLWLLYRTHLFTAMQHDMGLHAVVHVHMLVAGVLFTVAVCQLEPLRHRYSMVFRAATLVGVGAAHAVLAKTLYAAPPPGTGFALVDVRTGAETMYYAGDVIEVSLALILALQWYAARGRRTQRVHQH